MSTSTEETVEEAIKLFTVQSEDGQVDATVPVRWCVSREIAMKLQQMDVQDPQILLVISNNGHVVNHYVVPLFNEMHYVQFFKPGENLIHATVVWSGSTKTMKKWLAQRADLGQLLTSRRPRTDELDRTINRLWNQFYNIGDPDDEESLRLRTELDQLEAERNEVAKTEAEYKLIMDFDVLHGSDDEPFRIEAEAKLGVMVPEAMFAKEPPRWMKWFSSFYKMWEREPRDQCIMRRRALFTIATMLFYLIGRVLAFIIVTLVAGSLNLIFTGGLLLLGMRNIDYRSLRYSYRPWDYPPSKAARWIKPSVWWYREVEGEHRTHYEPRHPALLVISPPVVLVFVFVGVVLQMIFGSLLFIIVGGSIAFALGLLVLVVSLIAAGPLAKAAEKRAKEREIAEAAAKEEAKNRLNKEFEQLACSSASREVRISALPKEHQTVTLKFMDLKSKVCRPFAR